MGTEQDDKKAFSDRPQDTEVLARPVSSQSQYVPSATSLRAAPLLTPLRTAYAVATPSGRAGSPTDVKNVKLFSHMAPNGTSADTASPVQHSHYVLTGNEENMDVVQTLAELHTADRPGYGRSQGIIIISQDEDGEMVVQKNESVSLEKGEEKMLKKIAKTATVRPLKSDKDAAYASLDTDILQKLVRYEGEEATKKITMKELRHVIPLLIMRCFNMTEEPYQRKVRGMWTEKPVDWPTDIPFCDPNNKKDMGKPKKSTLLTMFMYLRNVYTESNVGALERYKARKSSVSSPRPLLEAMETVTTTTAAMPSSLPSTSLGHIGAGPVTPSPYTSISVRDHDSPSPPTPQVLQGPPTPPAPPVQTMQLSSFSELNQDWDPEEESMSRINKKMKWLKHNHLLPDQQRDMLHMIGNVISKMYQVRSQDHLFFLEIVHDFEATLDTVRVTGELPDKSIYKWQEFHENHQGVPDVAASEQVLDISEDTVACEPLGLGREEEVITDNNLVVSTTAKYPDFTNDEQDNMQAPAHILDTSSQELAYSDPASYPATNLQEIPFNKNDNYTYPPDYNMGRNIQYQGDHYKKNYDQYGHGIDPLGKEDQDLTSELGNLLKSSLHMTEDVNYSSQQAAASPPSGGSRSPTGSVQLPDASDVEVFPLSSEASDIMKDNELFHNTVLMEEEEGGGQAQGPSTHFVSVADQGLNNTHIIQQEQSTSFSNIYNNTINLDKLKIPTHGDDLHKAEKVRNMAQAFYLLQQKTQQPMQAAPPPVLNAGYNQVIPLVVEDLEKEVLLDDQPNRKKRRTGKRPFPSTEMTMG